MNTNQILASLRKQKKKIDSERERLHHAIVAFERLAGKAIEAGKRKYRQSAKAKQAISKAQKARWAKLRAKKKNASA
jgi:hypothetical protein